jgi:hypothetical protein
LNRVLLLCTGLPGMVGPQSSYICLPHNLNDRHRLPCPAFYWLRWSHANNFLPGLASNHDPSDLRFPSSYEYMCEPLHVYDLTTCLDVIYLYITSLYIHYIYIYIPLTQVTFLDLSSRIHEKLGCLKSVSDVLCPRSDS